MELAGCRIRRLLSRRDHDVSRSTSLHDDDDSRVSVSQSDDDRSLASDEEQLLDTTGSHILSWLIVQVQPFRNRVLGAVAITPGTRIRF